MSQLKLSSKKRAITMALTALNGILEQLRKYVDEQVQFPNDSRQLLLYIEGRRSHLNKGRSVIDQSRKSLKEKMEELFTNTDEGDADQVASTDEYAQRVERIEEECENLTFTLIERLEELATQQRISAELQRQAAAAASAPPSRGPSPPVIPDARAQQPPANNFRLPEIALPTFDGEVAKFAEFWSAFEQAIHSNQSMTAPVKLQYLRTLLKGPALTAVRSQPFTAEGYRHTVDLIKDRFGSDGVVREELLKKLMSLQTPSVKGSAALLNIIEDLVRKLRDAGEPVDNQLFLETIIRKFSNEVIERVIEARLATPGPTTAENLMTVLRTAVNYLEMKDKFSTQLKTQPAEVKKQPEASANADRRPDRKEFGQKKNNFQPTDRSTYPQPAGNHQPPKKTLGPRTENPAPPPSAATNDKCFVCNGAHSPSTCTRPIFATREAFRSQQRCFRCSGTDHRIADCQKVCDHCKGAHHVSLCIRLREERDRNNATASVAVIGKRKRAKSRPKGTRKQQTRQERKDDEKEYTLEITIQGDNSEGESPTSGNDRIPHSKQRSVAYVEKRKQATEAPRLPQRSNQDQKGPKILKGPSSKKEEAIHNRNVERKKGKKENPATSSLMDNNSAMLVAPETKEDAVAALSAGSEMMVGKLNFRGQESPHTATVFYDTGCTWTFVSANFAQQLGLKMLKPHHLNLQTFDANKRQDFWEVELVVEADNQAYKIAALVTPTIRAFLRPTPPSKEDSEYIRERGRRAVYAEGDVANVEPDLIIGLGSMLKLCDLTGIEYLPSGNLCLPTVGGDIIIKDPSNMEGPVASMVVEGKQKEPEEDSPRPVIVEHDALAEENFLEKYWAVQLEGAEAMVPKEKVKEEGQQALREFFEKTTKYQKTNKKWHISVRLPVEEEQRESMSVNYGIAAKRLENFLQKNKRDVLQAVSDLFDEYLDRDMIELAHPQRKTGAPGEVCYLPHHCVVKMDKATTKIRPVFDGSAAEKGKKSLNSLLPTGRDAVSNLTGILLRARAGKYLVTGDLEKAFLHVRINELDRDLCRFLWVKDVTKSPTKDNILVYRFKVLPFGLTSSPYLLNQAIRFHLNNGGFDGITWLRRDLMNCTYVDNVIVATDQRATGHIMELKRFFESCDMCIRDFSCNDLDAMRYLNDNERDGSTGPIPLLGLHWDRDNDQLLVKAKVNVMDTLTKRRLASAIASIFDPMGWLEPVILPLRLHLQELWRKNIPWDTELKDEEDRFRKTADNIDGTVLRFQRHAVTYNSDLVVFCDASEKAYSAVVYAAEIRQANILMSRTKLAPLKGNSTIPKLELQAVTLGMRLLRHVLQNLPEKQVRKCYVYTDSTIVLAQLNKKELSTREDGVFVFNRVKEIRDIANDKIFFGEVRFGHISSEENPADIASRGTTPSGLHASNWMKGPSFLTTYAHGPEWPTTTKLKNIIVDVEQSPVFNVTRAENSPLDELFPKELLRDPRPPSLLTAQESEWTRRARIAALVLRFVRLITKPRQFADRIFKKVPFLNEHLDEKNLSCKAVNTGKMWLVFLSQQQAWPHPDSEKELKNLRAFKDPSGILRATQRMTVDPLPDVDCSPPIVPGKSRVAKWIVDDIHRKTHGGLQPTLARVRISFWITKPRSVIQKIIRACVPCQRERNRPFSYPAQPPLPHERTMATRPFMHTGIDMAGPIMYATPNGKEKLWILAIVCLTTRAIYLDTVKSLSTKAFMNALTRFTARRGVFERALSDNQPSFILGADIFKTLLSNEKDEENFARHATNQGLSWSFIPAYSPWWGGVYERMIGLTKSLLHKTFPRRIPDEDELVTALADIEGIINSRPLTDVHTGDDWSVLRPIDFLQKGIRIQFPRVVIDELDGGYFVQQDWALQTRKEALEAIRYTQKYSEKFWTLFKEEYLSALRERNKWSAKFPKKGAAQKLPIVGQLVLIPKTGHRSNWPLAKVLELVPSRDGQVRAARVLLASHRESIRAICNMIPLELSHEADEGNLIPTTPETTVWRRFNLKPHEELGDANLEIEWDEEEEEDNSTADPAVAAMLIADEPEPFFRGVQFKNDRERLQHSAPLLSTLHGHGLVRRQAIEDRVWQELQEQEEIERQIEEERQFEEDRFYYEGDYGGNNWHGSYGMIFFACLMSLALPLASADNVLSLVCTPTGTTVHNEQRRPFTLCSEGFCVTRNDPETTSDITLPPSIRLEPHQVTLKYQDNKGGTTSFRTRCEGVDFCKGLDCTFCPESILNVECHPWATISIIGVLLYVILVGLFVVCMTPFRIGRPLQLVAHGIRRVCTNLRRKRTGTTTRKRSISNYVLIPIALVTMVRAALACSQVDVLTLPETTCQEKKCSTTFPQIFLLASENREACSFLTLNGTVVAEARLSWDKIRLICHKETLAYSLAVKHKVASVKRCPHAGSCKGSACEDATPDTVIPELHEANHLPGVTKCQESCGGPGCGCLLPSNACLFWREALEPVSREPVEIFHCPSWRQVATLKFSLTHRQTRNTHTGTLELELNEQQTVGGHSFELDSISWTPMKVLNDPFIRHKEHLALFNDRSRIHLLCETEDAARTVNCTAKPECSCRPTGDRLQCECVDHDILQNMKDLTKALPLFTPAYAVLPRSLVPEIHTSGKAIITTHWNVSFNSAKIEENADTCHVVQITELRGCYSCARGAFANITCKSQQGKQVASVRCSGHEGFMVPCSPQGMESTVRIYARARNVNLACSIQCGTGETGFRIQGALHYQAHKFSPLGSLKVYEEQPMEDWPDFRGIVEKIQEWSGTCLVAAIIVAITFYGTYVFGPGIIAWILMGRMKKTKRQ